MSVIEQLQGVPAAPESGDRSEQAHHLQRRLGTFAPLVPDSAATALNRLLQRFAGQDAEQDRQIVLQGELAEAQTDLPINLLIVRGLASNDRSQAQDRGEPARRRQPLGHQRDLPSPRYIANLDALIGYSMRRQGADRPLEQLSGDGVVVLRYDDSEPGLRRQA